MQLRTQPRASATRSRTAEARGLADQLHDWLLVVESSRGGRDAVPLVVERPDGSVVAVHLLRAADHTAEEVADELVGDLLSVATLRALGLTRREAEVMQVLARGKSNQEIASQMTVSVRTVEKHLENLYEKLGARSRTQAVLTAWSIGRACGLAPSGN
jgi:ATP/maltotriose-dependent transcriptional regulator MalT